jgi:hypothetical protein
MTTMMTMVTLRPFSRVMKHVVSFRTDDPAVRIPPEASLPLLFG